MSDVDETEMMMEASDTDVELWESDDGEYRCGSTTAYILGVHSLKKRIRLYPREGASVGTSSGPSARRSPSPYMLNFG